MSIQLAIVGASGAVGNELLRVLEKRNFPLKGVKCLASHRSLGKEVMFKGRPIVIEELNHDSFQGIDLAIFSAGGTISRTFVPIALASGAIVIDNSSAFRMEPDVPLIIPEVNPHALLPSHRVIACPNCSTAIMLMAIAPLHRHFKIQRIAAATYQAASGAGYRAMEELKEETRAHLEGRPFERTAMPHPYAFNLFPHNSSFEECGYAGEELKMIHESRKILEDDTLKIHATCVRVPVLRAHAEALNVTFQEPVSVEEAYAVLGKAPGVCVLEDRPNNRFPMPIDATGQDAIFCGRIRTDFSLPNTLDLWVVGDQLLKGAALNAVQIAELLLEKKLCKNSC